MVCKGERYLEQSISLFNGTICVVCGYTCHEECHKNIKKCLGLNNKKRPISPDIFRPQVREIIA